MKYIVIFLLIFSISQKIIAKTPAKAQDVKNQTTEQFIKAKRLITQEKYPQALKIYQDLEANTQTLNLQLNALIGQSEIYQYNRQLELERLTYEKLLKVMDESKRGVSIPLMAQVFFMAISGLTRTGQN